MKNKNINYKKVITVFTLITAILLNGCVNFRSQNIEKKSYAINIQIPKNTQPKKRVILEVTPTKITRKFDTLNFVYRINDIAYTSDYYNTFFTSPAEEIQQNIISYLQALSFFSYVDTNTYPAKPNYILKSNITQIYADYRNKKSPKAVLAIQFVLFANNEKNNILINKHFRTQVPLQEKSSRALIYGLTEALEINLRELKKCLEKISSLL